MLSLQLLHTRVDRREIIGSTGSSQGALRILFAGFLAGSMENYGSRDKPQGYGCG
jgi:hypothetical protein